MSPERLSCGCKAVILMEVVDGSNVYASKCSDNCALDIVEISSRKDVTITLHHPMRFPVNFEAIMMGTGVVVYSDAEFVDEYYRIVHMHEDDEIDEE